MFLNIQIKSTQIPVEVRGGDQWVQFNFYQKNCFYLHIRQWDTLNYDNGVSFKVFKQERIKQI